MDEISRGAFIATVSHELRTPLNGIIGMATLLQESSPQTPKQKEYLTILMECSLQLMNLVNNILDYTKMSGGKLKLTKAPFRIKDVIDTATKVTKSRADFKKLDFIVDVSDDIPTTLIGDAHRLVQIFINLLINAIKFTDQGFVKTVVKCHKKESTDTSNYILQVDITDSGVGIEPQDQQEIFTKFNNVEHIKTKSECVRSPSDSLYTATNGTGLGLAICKELCKLMNGDISVFSKGNKQGSTFSFFVELEEEMDTDKIESKFGILRNKKVLIVDDRLEFRIMLTKIILKWGMNPTTVSSADEALVHLQLGGKSSFDCAIIDICMPYMSGTDLAIEIRNLNPSLPLIAISSTGDASGSNLFNYFLHKPVDSNNLVLILREIFSTDLNLKRESITSSSDSEVSKISKSKLRVLIAEDEYSNTIVITEMLKSLGISAKNIKTTTNGEMCINALKKSKRGYHLVILDIIMPVMNGIEVAKWISKNITSEKRHKMTVIAMSAAVENTNKSRCQLVGIDSYLNKPIIKSKLECIIRSITV